MKPSFRMRISTKLALFLFFAGMLPMAVFGVLYIWNEQEVMEEEVFDALVLLAESKEVRILEYFNNITARTVDFSSDGYIRDETKRLLSDGSDESRNALNRHLLVNKKPIDDRLAGVSILNKDGTIIASTDEKEIGKNESNDAYFKEGLSAPSLIRTDPWDVHFNITSPFVVAAPITDKDTHESLAVIVNVFDPAKLESILSANFFTNKNTNLETIIGNNIKTLHAYIVDHEKNVILHPVRKEVDHERDAMVGTLPVRECLENGREILGEYTDHSGAMVLGASMCIMEKGMVLIVDIEKSEALLPAQQAQAQFFGIISVLALVIAAFSYFMSQILTRPIKALQKSAEIVRAGDLQHRGAIARTGDEIEELGHAFNAMTASLEERQKKTEEERQKFSTLIEHLPIGVFMIEATGEKLVAANPKTLELFGKKKDFLEEPHTYADLYSAIHPQREDGAPFPKEKIPVMVALREGRIAESDDVVVLREGGGKITLRVIGVPVKDESGKVVYALAVFDDVTKEHEIDRAKTEFVSLASHQLRTPLSTINWYTEMLLAEDVGKLKSDQKTYLEEIYKGSQRMVALVNSLLNVSRIEIGTFAVEITSIDICEELEAAVKEFDPMIVEKKMDIQKECSPEIPTVHADKKMIRMIFQNLISNALKYTPSEGRVTVRIRREGDDHVYIEVSDTGYGIPKYQYDKIFTKLFRADNIVAKDTEGTGLGLYLIKLIVDELKGKIWFTSEEGKGTSFFIILPIGK